MRIPLFSAFLALAAPTWAQNGPIHIAGRQYPSWSAFTQSAEFIQNGLRCGGPALDPERAAALAGAPSDCGYFSTNPAAQYAPTFVYDIPVVVHVIQRTNGEGNISQALVQSQIAVLNEDFRAMAGTNGAGGADTMIQFHLATQDPGGNPTGGITYSTNNTWFNDGGSYWNSLAWDPDNYMNIYTNSASGNLGYVPDIPQGGIVGSNSDRVVVLWSSFGLNGPIGPPFNKGRTTTHEVGHYLGLAHTFDGGCSSGNCNTTGDLICDTNRESSPNNGCSPGSSSCNSPDPVHNYMNYSDDLCMFEFTPDQARRMRCTLDNWRPDLASIENLPTNYCDAVINSTGQPALLSLLGSTSIAVDDFALISAPVPVDTSIFIYSLDPSTEVSIGNGNLCIGAATLGFFVRGPGLVADPFGFTRWDVDFANPPVPEAQITPGSTWYFQHWYRDNVAGPGQVNWSDAMEIQFSP